MANLDAQTSLKGLDDLIKAMQQADLFDEATQTELLAAGTGHLRKMIEEEADRAKYNLKFVSPNLTKDRTIKKDKNGNYYMTVTLRGKNKRGEQYRTVAFVLNYGRREKYGKIEGCFFWTRAVRRAEKTILSVYEDIVEKKLNERGLI